MMPCDPSRIRSEDGFPIRRWCAALSRHALSSVALAVATITVPAAAAAGDWPGFHGLSAAGVVADAVLPENFTRQEPRWTIDLMTRDVGSIAIQGGHVYVLSMAPSSPSIRLISFDLDSGRERWSREFPQIKNHLHSRNTLASSTPATDDKYVYVAHSDREHTWVRCLDHDGNEIWQRDFGTAQSQHGFGTSPTVHGESLVLNFSQQGEEVENGPPGVSRVISMNRSTGETIWETPVTTTKVCYGTPLIHDGKVICASTGDGIFALSLQTGELLWRLPVFSMRCVGTAVVAGDLAIGSSGSGGGGNHLVAVKMPSADQAEPVEAYRITKAAPYVPTPVVHQGMLFTVDDKGVASCFDVATGQPHWTNQRIGAGVGACPILIGGKLLMISLEGEATVVRAAPSFEKLSQFHLGGPVGASPAFAEGRLVVRVGTELRCY